MEIRYHKNFIKGFSRLTPKQKKKVIYILQKFADNPHDSILNNHSLEGKLQNFRSISAGYDLRIIFQESNNYNIIELTEKLSNSE